MAERKVINKYIHPDFDPNKVKKKLTGGGSGTVRLMTPFSMRCNTCGEYIYRRKKFNARKETVADEDYLGLPIYRFYIKCPVCSASITFKTDPKNTDYVAEQGAQRNFEPWRDEKFLERDLQAEEEAKEALNPMQQLEQRTKESKREMEILDALDELKTKNAQLERVDADSVLEGKLLSRKKAQESLEKAEDDYVKSLFYSSDGAFVKRLDDDYYEDGNSADDQGTSSSSKDIAGESSSSTIMANKNAAEIDSKGILSSSLDPSSLGIKRKKGPKSNNEQLVAKKPNTNNNQKNSTLASLAQYNSDSDSD